MQDNNDPPSSTNPFEPINDRNIVPSSSLINDRNIVPSLSEHLYISLFGVKFLLEMYYFVLKTCYFMLNTMFTGVVFQCQSRSSNFYVYRVPLTRREAFRIQTTKKSMHKCA